ncbi:bumetanide-sensitive sodium-(potassium)-chloride cotransporter-like isoform X1 [Hetaerina americana]|uniref:bumetanide-sensitive sodium-(potassium)-chloride cotransporter-like isoform X1 n=2 Tax=Hetaerina americana TaxID=62018 RepID=UPI003A7F40B2
MADKTSKSHEGGRKSSWGVEMANRRTRFQVNRVETGAASTNGEMDPLNEGDDVVERYTAIGDEDSGQRKSSNAAEEMALINDGAGGDGARGASPTVVSHNHEMSTGYDTRYAKSFRHFTREALPRLDNYRNIMSIQAAYRPTLDELHNETLHGKPGTQAANAKNNVGESEGMVKFGWIKGVLVRCLLNIWGVMLFLRLSWVVAQAGIGEAMLLIIATSVVTTITALSMSAISTNGEIKGGGTYYMISRSLGPEFGGSIGLIFSLANAVACAMYVVGFCEAMVDLLGTFELSISGDKVHDIRIIGSITIILLLGIVVIGMEWEAKAQLVLLVVLVAAMFDFIIGTFIGPLDAEEESKGFIGYSVKLFKENFWSDYRYAENVNHDFFSVFSIFFPAATGILAGANISGDLADPQGAIPKGTLLAIVITTVSYLLFAVMAGGTMERDASGIISDLYNGTAYICANRTEKCEWGLHNSFQVMELVSAFGPIIYAGCFAATLSSALASLVSAPKVFQALCKDELYPYITWFARGYGKNNEPVRGYILTFFIAVAFILIAELNAIAPLISNFFLAAYALINFSTFHASLIKPIGWRPTFKFYNMWMSLAGAILCVLVMFMISWWTALLTLAVVLALYLIVTYRKPDVNWGSTTQAQTYKNALVSVQQLNNVEDHVKNYRPQILVLSGMPNFRPPLIDFAYLITKNLSLMICGHILKGPVPQRVHNSLAYKGQSWLRAHRVKGFYNHVDEVNFEDGAKALLQASGIGKLRPNILLMGFKADWRECPRTDLIMYFNVMHKALDLHMAVAILRLREGLDYSNELLGAAVGKEEPNGTGVMANGGKGGLGVNGAGGEGGLDVDKSYLDTRTGSQCSLPRNQSFSQMSQELYKFLSIGLRQITTRASSMSDVSSPGTPRLERHKEIEDESPSNNAEDGKGQRNESRTCDVEEGRAETDREDITEVFKNSLRGKKERKEERMPRTDHLKGPGGADLPKELLHRITQFQRRQRKGTIDVWWLYDDGGLTLLLPYIISTRRNWSSCKLRVFALANKKDELDFEQRSMASLLAKFRIDYSVLKVIPDITKKPKEETKTFFDGLISDFVQDSNNDDDEENSATITEAELLAMKDKTNRHLRLRELLIENSMEANLVVMTLPMPRKGVVSAPLYMAWLEALTQDMPPFLLVRGNQTSVLTFYS